MSTLPEIESVIGAVREASRLMLTDAFEVESKGGYENIVTSSDLAVQDFLCERLASLLPGCGFICEEEGICTPDREYVWVIDPIDGTANYARHLPDSDISVALKHGDEVVMGVIYIPSRDEMHYAMKGSGAFCNGRKISVSSRPFDDSVFCTAMSTYRKEFAGICSDIIMETYYQCNDVRRYGSSAVELCLLASGKCDLYFEMRLMPWDYAAGILLVREAGGTITNLSGEQPRFEGPDLVCAANNAANHERLLGIIRSHLAARPYED